MDTPDIKVVTDPKNVAALIDPTQQVNNDFEKTLADIEADKAKKAEDTKRLAELQTPKGEMKPLHLTYRFEGGCPKCSQIPETIMIDAGEAGYFATAYCIKDHEQLRSEKVAKLPEVKTPEVILVPKGTQVIDGTKDVKIKEVKE